MRRALLRTALASIALLTAAASAEASGRRIVHPADRAENRSVPLTGALPACDDPAVLGEITSWFNTRESRFWGPLQAVAYDHIRPIGYRPLGDESGERRADVHRYAWFTGRWSPDPHHTSDAGAHPSDDVAHDTGAAPTAVPPPAAVASPRRPGSWPGKAGGASRQRLSFARGVSGERRVPLRPAGRTG